ncbi:hypothetical protein PPTG_10474 [Phytophthora nicotianae INRA-310]|uniref:RxLR effector protein n=1 Tax=Phytophthora nicotianae (strain INRA-310) TaxID=761204 RepID=W2QFI5_PHYN3|nr:hypothetical protein PPTG_10474 [Phytophthora nicotianae INRA-310]ETN11636.1 hypothetical protein PPTG_10474 [Phytophthora nicotianae INRA-310]
MFTKYVDDYNAKNRNTITFNGPTLVKKLVSATDDPNAKSIAEKLLGSVDNVLTTLNINKDKLKAISSGKLDALEQFIKMKGSEDDVIATLTSLFGGHNNLANILDKEKRIGMLSRCNRNNLPRW